ncbi:MAG: FHA domain-containing protein [Alphaproteobacteria bacterium]|nr:FHA domain-containing protein [Alphaproteobacteria bacterium]
MAVFAELEIVGAPAESPRCVVGSVACVVGRSATCDYVVERKAVSREHAAFWVQGDAVMVRDLRSRNGTFVNDKRIDASHIGDGDIVRLGNAVTFRIHVRSVPAGTKVHERLALEDVATGHRFLLGALPVRVGSHPDCAVRLPDGPAVRGVISSPHPGEAWFGVDDDMTEIAIGEAFDVGGHAFRVVIVQTDPGSTISEAASPWPYRVRATLDAEGGPRAVVEDAQEGRRHELVGTNRAILLYLLARKWTADASQEEVDFDEVGWCADDDLAMGLWGREGVGRPIKVLVCRLRAELREAGFDPWFVEKRRGALRIRALEASVE